ncbi:ATPase family protein associated with various cellular activities (AAA) [Sphaerotilus hippei]|uniref:ATPase family protein associated with various cellular activities (AAA) n=1 Tax=Sphaerotilus hippei TaxID=744406 RepID=A0A318H8N5_9BURK|nr:ATP-binding protein [Sphaerotilus hippei]PXW94401.1 ATPase family protein associated with various cellular activities (AAA) [Sphaerotilus hippei]
MKLHLDRPHVLALTDAFPGLERLQEQLRYGHRIEVAASSLSLEALDFLADLYLQAGSALAGRAAQLRGLVHALRHGAQGQRFAPGSELEALLPALLRYLIDDGRRGWLFAANTEGKPLGWVVTRVDFVAGSSEENAKLMIELKAQARATVLSQSIRLADADLRHAAHPAGPTIAELLAAKGFLKETPELLAAADASLERYIEWRGRYGALFNGSGIGFHAEDPNATHRDTDWARKDRIVLASGGGLSKLVNDEGILPPRSTALDAAGDVVGPYLRKAGKSSDYEYEDEVKALRERLRNEVGQDGPLFSRLPVHAYLFMFHLELHQHLWVHVDDIEPHVYTPELKGKLVLPREQTDLIDILTAEMDVLMDDIVAGKSGGTTVLCAGPPGVGKTLTAEVYAEVIGRPLYRVHSGQLGLSVAAMESALKEALTRAQRWGAVMLIDEADVYIRKRSDDIAANAVVGVFLRVLEYFNGLLFLTTNRIDDIDEAIVSRCIALIRYHSPDRAARERIWRVMAGQFALALDETRLAWLAEAYPEASGRDIKGLAKLVAKYCHHKQVLPSVEVFQRCAIFRGLDGLHD